MESEADKPETAPSRKMSFLKEMDEKHVVTCFLKREDGKILIMKRSEKVSTYQGRWGGVAGYLEDEPLKQAFKEIEEETGLKKEEVELIKEGSPIEVIDGRLRRKWVVHPFLFYVKNPRIKIDWEHTEIKWIDPEEMKELPTVPGLYEAWKNVVER
jgi:8-oxo-dGTP diphosphatase